MEGLSHRLLMQESRRRVERAACSADVNQRLVAQRVLTDARAQGIWESEHAHYMQRVAGQRRPQRQRMALRLLVFELVHRKALFEYLGHDAVRGDRRRRIVALFHGSLSYTEAVVAEHGLYLRSTLSQLCAEHIGCAVVDDRAFHQAVPAYEGLYAQYFRFFCEKRSRADEDDDWHDLLRYLKRKVMDQRRALLAADDRPSVPARAGINRPLRRAPAARVYLPSY